MSVLQIAHEEPELDSDNDNMNKIEPTKAEAEAIQKGLQVCNFVVLFFCVIFYCRVSFGLACITMVDALV